MSCSIKISVEIERSKQSGGMGVCVLEVRALYVDAIVAPGLVS